MKNGGNSWGLRGEGQALARQAVFGTDEEKGRQPRGLRGEGQALARQDTSDIAHLVDEVVSVVDFGLVVELGEALEARGVLCRHRVRGRRHGVERLHCQLVEIVGSVVEALLQHRVVRKVLEDLDAVRTGCMCGYGQGRKAGRGGWTV
eukprot:352150-Chlamydomonas_euryale.AAC.1